MDTNKIICSKDNIILKRHIIDNNNNNNNNNNFTIDFQIINKLNLNMKDIIDNKLFNLIGIINKDIIEKSEIVNHISDNELDILYIFKRFGADLGISKKYCFFKTIIQYNTNQIIIHSESIPYLENINEEPIICKYTKLYVTNYDQSIIDIHYNFSINIEEELPIYMQNMLGILMKKILNNFKLFIENIKLNNLDINNINNIDDNKM